MRNSDVFKHIIIALCVYTFISIISDYLRQSILIAIIAVFLLNIVFCCLKTSVKIKIPFDNRWQNLVYFYFVIWQLIVIIRGLGNYDSLEEFVYNVFLNPFSFLSYIIPLFLLLGYRNFKFPLFIKVSVILNILFIIVVIIFYKRIFLETYSLTSDESNGYGVIAYLTSRVVSIYRATSLVLLLPAFINKKIWNLNFVCWCIALVVIMIGARRSTTVSMILIGLAAIFFYLKQNNKKKFKRIVLVVLFLGGSLFFVSGHIDSTFSLLKERGIENTRKGVEDYFMQDMFKDTDDWIFGRGMGGMYISPLYPEKISPPRRRSIETGYLFIILNGGVISLFLYLILLLPAVYKGWFKSKNLFTQALSIYILISIIELYPFGIPAFSLHFMMIWISTAICHSKYIRNMTNDNIKQLIFQKI